MSRSLFVAFVISTLFSASGFAAAPVPGEPLPTLVIEDRGELVFAGEDDFSYAAWNSDTGPGKVHVVQYFGATLSDRDIFEPFTDLLQENFENGVVHVTTVLNLDAAMWGTRGMVVSELKKNKKKHPQATIVADDEALGVSTWELGKKGTGLMILDARGTVLFFNRGALDKEQLAPAIELIRHNLGE